MSAESGEVVVEIVPGVLPVERGRGGVVAVLEGQDPGGEVVQVGEVSGGDGLSLEDGEVDLDLVQPGGVDG